MSREGLSIDSLKMETIVKKSATALAIAALFLTTGCTNLSKTEQGALSGGAIGAGVGAAATAIAGSSVAAGMIVGGAVGAAAGAYTGCKKEGNC
jgi:osmotically inducible lipoprotein OsmB